MINIKDELKQHTTKCINHWQVVVKLNIVNTNKQRSKLKNLRFKMPNASYTQRWR